MTRDDVKAILYIVLEAMDYQDMMAKQHDCNDCGYACCKYRPRPGEWTRINCPHWKRREP